MLHKDMIIKVCGNARPDNVEQVASLTPMLMGFIFHKGSPRSACGLDPEVVKSLPKFIRPVGVFVDATADEIIDTVNRYGIRIVQLHGNEKPALAHALRQRCLTIFKACGPDPEAADPWGGIVDWAGAADMLILDTPCESHGGSGCKWDWSLLESYPYSTPYLISGGIGPDDIPAIISAMRAPMAGIDINSRFETSPGVKDLNLLIRFTTQLRSLNEDEPTQIPFWEKVR